MPSRKQDRSYGRGGSLNACSICGESITPDQNEIEIEFRLHGAPSDYYRLHVRDTTPRRRRLRSPPRRGAPMSFRGRDYQHSARRESVG